MKTIKTPMLFRSIGLEARKIDEKNRRVELSFSSETPVDRYFGNEILDHGKKSVDLSFLNSGRAPLLKNHDTFEQTGVVESARIGTDRVGRAIVRFGNSDQAESEFQDIVGGIRQNVSVGYRINKMVLEEQSEENGDVYRIVDWEPLEVSIVSIPADQSVGIGRAANDRKYETIIENRNFQRGEINVMKDDGKIKRAEMLDIIALGEAHGFQAEANRALKDGKNLEQFRNWLLNKLGEKAPKPIEDSDPTIGLTRRETNKFSFVRLIRSLADPKNPKLAEEAGFELECSRAAAAKLKKTPNGEFIPWDVMISGQRDLNTTDDSALVATDHLAGSFIDVLRNKLVVQAAGARILDGLIGNVSIPKKIAGASVYWVAEGITNNPTESEATFGTVSLSPKTVGTFTEITRQMLAQSSPAIEQIIRGDLAQSVALEIDRVALHGTGASNQPTGIAATSGIGSVAGGTNGLAPAWSHIVGLESEVAIDNADIGALSYITNTKVRGKLKQVDVGTDTGVFVWQSGRKNGDGSLNGYRAHATNQVASNLDKGTSTGVCSAIFFGNWADLLIGQWGALDILVDPYTYSKSGGLLIRALQDIDIAVRHAESFAAMLDALTA